MLELIYPDTPSARNRWILARRGPKNRLDPSIPYAYLWEEESDANGELVSTATLFLTNRECPYRCLMCDLWQNTLDERVPVGAIPTQIRYALQRLPAARQIKLYNAGSFFDPNAIPPEEDAAIAEIVASFERVIVECHPALIGDRCLNFRDRLNNVNVNITADTDPIHNPQSAIHNRPVHLEVAVGLETAHTPTLAKLNKRFTLEDFQRSAGFLARHNIALRVFLLLRPPFMTEMEGLEWAKRSLDVAFAAGATVCCLIPTRAGNGAMETLAASGHFAPPSLSSLEQAQEYGLELKRGRVFADLWDVEKFYRCACSPARAERLAFMNRYQRVPTPILCDICIRKTHEDRV